MTDLYACVSVLFFFNRGKLRRKVNKQIWWGKVAHDKGRF